MKLLLDIGNSRIKWGLWDGLGWQDSGEFSSPDELAGLDISAREAVAACVAGPEAAAAIAGVCANQLGMSVHFLETPREGGGIRVAYSDAAGLGVDRWLAMVGARLKESGALCVVDAGTAVTVDMVDAHGQHLGGYIIPGLDLMASSLKGSTGDLERLSRAGSAVEQADTTPGLNTAEAIGNGAVLAVVGAIAGARSRLGGRDNGSVSVVLTGGNADTLAQHVPAPVRVQPMLVLEGMAALESC